ncbi:MAG: hypothetical protein GC201_16515 [Alphaproteobacteria bacterium]|nr:hypothetical protein [Alphaproteobacteria bacterium]
MLSRTLALIPAAALALAAFGAAADPASEVPEGKPPIDTPATQEGAAGNQAEPTHGTVHIGFTPAMKDTIRKFYRGKACPPGTEKPMAGCVLRTREGTTPPYALGKSLPGGLDLQPLPPMLLKHLTAPEGYTFGLVDGDVLLLDAEDHRVTDAYAAIDPKAP